MPNEIEGNKRCTKSTRIRLTTRKFQIIPFKDLLGYSIWYVMWLGEIKHIHSYFKEGNKGMHLKMSVLERVVFINVQHVFLVYQMYTLLTNQ